ncbi:Rieske (2Fe-2S) protein [Salinispora sp. H7-4]|uniref:Rieske (2Fe-2S) protein n=1 Tax=Salinispora sp. H7-4 TaxID=2748321 RepID=UPI0015D3339C|nr:Rieske (2Fe-2S) protein [Salinispora sp. H7-4]NYT95591.1 Rieske (2Fe-2S) protein [Salinispora sp. H7-4]
MNESRTAAGRPGGESADNTRPATEVGREVHRPDGLGPEVTTCPDLLDGQDRGRPGGCASRRRWLAGVGATGAVILSGCATYGNSAPATNSGGNTGGGDGTAAAGDAQDAPSGGQALAQAAEVPVGGGMILADAGVVITQPQEGTFKGFSATCTHQGCTVAEVSDGTINCPCHGSRFSVADGSVVGGPAPRSLDPRDLVVEGSDIRLA